MAHTITANSGAITLNSTTSNYNPLTVLAGVTVTGAGSSGINGDLSTIWTVTNFGTVTASATSTDGIVFSTSAVLNKAAPPRTFTANSPASSWAVQAPSPTRARSRAATTASG